MTTHEQAEQLERAMALFKEWRERFPVAVRPGQAMDAFLSGYGCGVADTEAKVRGLRATLDAINDLLSPWVAEGEKT